MFESLDKFFFDSSSSDNTENYKFQNEFYYFESSLFKSNYFLFNEKNKSDGIKIVENIDEINNKNSFLSTNGSTMKKEEKIFEITKEKNNRVKYHNLGRKKKRDKSKNGNIKCHDKMKEDNIIQKIKNYFVQSCLDFINKRHKDYKIKNNLKHKKLLLLKIKFEFAQNIKKEENLKFLNSKLRQIFSSDLSEKIKTQYKNYNRNNIDELFRNNKELEVIEILDKTVKELMEDYVKGIYLEEGFSLDIDLEKIKEKLIKEGDNNNIEGYIYNYKKTVINLENIFESKISRKRKTSKAKR